MNPEATGLLANVTLLQISRRRVSAAWARRNGMSWFRTRARWGSWLALFALALQLTLSFAHVHLGDASDPELATVLADDQPSPAGATTGPAHHAAACDRL